MRYQITITGELDTWADESQIQSDAPTFLRRVEGIHPGIVAGTVELASVERLPDPEPVPTVGDFDMTDSEARLVARFLEQVRADRQA